jgi:ankyrin repeat protein
MQPIKTHPEKRRRTKELDKSYQGDPSKRNHLGETPLIITTQLGAFRYAEKLIAAGVDVPVCDVRGRTPLHWSVEASLLSTVKQILSRRKVGVNAKDNRGETPIHYALQVITLA